MKDYIEQHIDDLHRNGESDMRKFDTGATRDSDDHPEKPSYYKALSPIVLREYVKYIGRHREWYSDGCLCRWIAQAHNGCLVDTTWV
jgi:hypothetical protein